MPRAVPWICQLRREPPPPIPRGSRNEFVRRWTTVTFARRGVLGGVVDTQPHSSVTAATKAAHTRSLFLLIGMLLPRVLVRTRAAEDLDRVLLHRNLTERL